MVRLMEVLSKPKNQVMLMKMTATLNLCLFVIMAVQYGCGKNVEDSVLVAKGNSPDQVRSVPESVEPYVSRFEKEFNVAINYPVEFFVTKDKVVGRCVTWTDGARKILLDSKYFSEASSAQKEQLVYHELGHCELRLDHDDSTIEFDGLTGKWPNSIMKSSTFDDEEAAVYEMHRDHYVKELKGDSDND